MHSRAQKRGGRVWEIALAAAVALVLGGVGGYFLGSRSGAPVPGSEPAANRSDRIAALGRLQPAGGVVPVFGPPGDRIAKLYPISPGEKLAEDAPIAVLESAKERDQELTVARAQVAEAGRTMEAAKRAGSQKILAAQAELNQAVANKKSDLDALDARIAYLQIQSAIAAGGLKRLKDLRTRGVSVAEEDFDKSRLLEAQAAAELKAGLALRDKSETTYRESEKAATARIEAAKAELDEAIARVPTESAAERLKLADELSKRTTLRAPRAGTVLRVIGREGQPTGIEPILQMADLSKMTAVAEVYESDVERLRAWVKSGPVAAEVKNPALGRALAGTVDSEADITRMIARNQVFAMGPREDADRRVVEVIVRLNPADAEHAGRLVGLQVTVSLEPKK